MGWFNKIKEIDTIYDKSDNSTNNDYYDINYNQIVSYFKQRKDYNENAFNKIATKFKQANCVNTLEELAMILVTNNIKFNRFNNELNIEITKLSLTAEGERAKQIKDNAYKLTLYRDEITHIKYLGELKAIETGVYVNK